MLLSLHTAYKKFTASFLLVLFVFIYAEKVLHTHDKESFKTEQKGISQGFNNTSCALCDFTIAKDGALPEPIVIDSPVTILFKEYTCFTVSYSYSSAAVISSRGPPAKFA